MDKHLRHAALGLLVLLIAAYSATALEIKASSDLIYLSSTEGQAYVYATNPFDEPATISFSATSSYLNAYFDAHTTRVLSGASSGALLNVRSPDCFRGNDVVRVYAQVCTDRECRSDSTTIRVTVTPARACDAYVEGLAPQESYVPHTLCDEDGCRYLVPKPRSKIIESTSFEPTEYSVSIRDADECFSVKRGTVESVQLQLRNRGAAGSFDVRALGVDTQIYASPNRDYISLSRSGVDSLRLDLKALPDAEEGRHFITLQLLHRADLVAETDLCINLVDDHASRLSAPESALVDPNTETLVDVELENLGTYREGYHIMLLGVPGGINVAPQGFFLEPGEVQELSITFTPRALKAKESVLEVIALGDHSEARASIHLTRKEAEVPATISEPLEKESGNQLFTYAIIVTNELDESLHATFEIEGLPENWKATLPDAFDLPARGEVEVPVEIRSGSSETAHPVLLVKRDGEVIGRQPLPTITGSSSGLTGFLTIAFSEGGQFIVILLLIAFLVILMFSRQTMNQGSAENLANIKSEVDGASTDHNYRAEFSQSLQRMKDGMNQ
ncbi:hypothetical protein KJ765_05355 [Candidatus Micrarchaeota archaeon]|nr:hypothetical protein [Candidatus Micrarchaeota archaeon]